MQLCSSLRRCWARLWNLADDTTGTSRRRDDAKAVAAFPGQKRRPIDLSSLADKKGGVIAGKATHAGRSRVTCPDRSNRRVRAPSATAGMRGQEGFASRRTAFRLWAARGSPVHHVHGLGYKPNTLCERYPYRIRKKNGHPFLNFGETANKHSHVFQSSRHSKQSEPAGTELKLLPRICVLLSWRNGGVITGCS
jgi:hypothetical protein